MVPVCCRPCGSRNRQRGRGSPANSAASHCTASGSKSCGNRSYATCSAVPLAYIAHNRITEWLPHWRQLQARPASCSGRVREHRRRVRHGSVTAIDNFDPFYPRGVKDANITGLRSHPRLRMAEIDIRSTKQLRSVAASYDVIVHLAAKAGVRPSILEPALYQQVNVAGTQNMLELARECGAPQFVFASSSNVYGTNPRAPWSESDNVLQPISPYASTKISGELLGHVYSHLYGIRFIGLRLFTVYGPRQRPDLAIHKFAQLIETGLPVPIYGDGSTSRDYTYVADIVSGIRSAIEYQGSRYEIINLGNNRTVPLLEMLHTLECALGRKAAVEFNGEQAGDVRHTFANIEKAKNLLNYHPDRNFTEGVAEFVRWFREPQRRRITWMTYSHSILTPTA